MFPLCTGMSLYLPIIWLFRMGAHWLHWKACRVDSVLWQFQMGGSIGRFTLNLPVPYIFLLFDCFEWALIDRIEKCRVHSALWQFWMGGSIGRFTLNLPFPYIFLLFDCFEWVLIDCIEKHRVHSVVWQFQMGGRGVNWQIYPKSARFELPDV